MATMVRPVTAGPAGGDRATGRPSGAAGADARVADYARRILSEGQDLEGLRRALASEGLYQEAGGRFLVRIRLPLGALTARQLRALAEQASLRGSGIVHFTTRHSAQVHGVELSKAGATVAAFGQAGLWSWATGGDTVRGVTICPGAGVCTREAFDVSPLALATSDLLLSQPDATGLPRKFKVAFSGCARDCAGAVANDVGFIALARAGPGPQVVALAGGGMGPRSRLADVLFPTIAAGRAPAVAEAARRVFSRYGDRSNRKRARLRYLVEDRGIEAFRSWLAPELSGLGAAPEARVVSDVAPSVPSSVTTVPGVPDRWVVHNVEPQRQPGKCQVWVRLDHGDADEATLRALASLLDELSCLELRATVLQELVLRHVPVGELPLVYRRLDEAGLARPLPPIERNLLTCRGRPVCRKGVCDTRRARVLLLEALAAEGLIDAECSFRIAISGCSNACAKSPIADISMHGVRRAGRSDAGDHYMLQFGGSLAPQPALAEPAGAFALADAVQLVVDHVRGRVAHPIS